MNKNISNYALVFVLFMAVGQCVAGSGYMHRDSTRNTMYDTVAERPDQYRTAYPINANELQNSRRNTMYDRNNVYNRVAERPDRYRTTYPTKRINAVTERATDPATNIIE